jgi:hypothetical protein
MIDIYLSLVLQSPHNAAAHSNRILFFIQGGEMEDIGVNNGGETPCVNGGATPCVNGGATPCVSLENTLAARESDAKTILKAAVSVVTAVKKHLKNTRTGNLRDLGKTFESVEQASDALGRQLIDAKEGLKFDGENYVAGRAFIDEILEMSKSLGIKMFEQDDRLYCYPLLLRVLPNELVVQIDKRKEKLLRPSALLSHLKTLQNKPVRFKSDAFLESLYSACEILIKSRGKDRADRADQAGKGIVIRLMDIYELLTLMPGQAREYSRQEFARDIYFLDRSGVTATKKGFVISFSGSTGLKSSSKTIRVITEEGLVKIYYGISFSEV